MFAVGAEVFDATLRRKTDVVAVCELAGDAEPRFQAFNFHANYSYPSVESEPGRLAWDHDATFQVLSR
jgi:hypothetical protein